MAFDSYLIRQRFLHYFAENGHTLLPSSAVTNAADPSLFFTNAGMNQFKDYFLGRAEPKNQRVATCQACMRAGGKHNDLDNVGHTKRHLTLFEMLGNFSFGDYFKRQAIDFAWQVSTEILNSTKSASIQLFLKATMNLLTCGARTFQLSGSLDSENRIILDDGTTRALRPLLRASLR